MTLEDLQPGASVRGILPDGMVAVVSVDWHGSDALTLIYRQPNGQVAQEILFRHDEGGLEIAAAGRPSWNRWARHSKAETKAWSETRGSGGS